jgi:hypothetical protein
MKPFNFTFLKHILVKRKHMYFKGGGAELLNMGAKYDNHQEVMKPEAGVD